MGFNPEKLRAAVLFICRRVRDPSKLGKVKLHKILWYSDGEIFRKTGEPITGERYIKHDYGPFATHMDATLNDLVRARELYIHTVDHHGMEKTEFVAKADPDMSQFTEKEIRILGEQTDYITEDHTAASISDRSHKAIWEMAEMFEELPFEALLCGRLAPVTEDDFAWAREVIKEKG